MRKRVLFLCITITLLVLNGCGIVPTLTASEELVINSTEELYKTVEESLKEGQTEIHFVTETLGQDDLKKLNQEHDGFYGNVTQYEIKTLRFFDKSYVTLQCEISDNYYVEEAILNGKEISTEDKKVLELKEACEKVLSKLENVTTEYQKEKKIHDYLVKNIAYGYPEGRDTADSAAYNAYGALVEGKAVCNGYAQAMKLLCDLSGLECTMISGQADGESHAWNLVRLGKEWYHVDVTWDDPEPDEPGRVLYSYFNLSDEEMKQSHIWETEDYTPSLGEKYQYYRKNDLYCENIKEFQEKCAEIFEKDRPESIQLQVGDYEESRYSEENLQFIFQYSGAAYIHLQTIGEPPYTTLYFTLDY